MTKGVRWWYIFYEEYLPGEPGLLAVKRTVGGRGWEMDTTKSTQMERPIVSIILVGINIVVFLVCQFTDLPYLLGRENVLDVVYRKEYWRILSAMFLHVDQYHIFNNMLILYFLGEMLEREIGHIRYAILYFLSGIGGGTLSLWLRYLAQDGTSSIGASAAVFGLDGALLAMMLFAGRRLPNATPVRVLLMVGLSLYSGFVSSNVDNAGHVGGLLAGFVVTCIFCLLDRLKKRPPQDQGPQDWGSPQGRGPQDWDSPQDQGSQNWGSS